MFVCLFVFFFFFFWGGGCQLLPDTIRIMFLFSFAIPQAERRCKDVKILHNIQSYIHIIHNIHNIYTRSTVQPLFFSSSYFSYFSFSSVMDRFCFTFLLFSLPQIHEFEVE